MTEKSRRRRFFWLTLLGLVLIGLTTLAIVNREDVQVGLLEEIRFDNFAFTARSVRTATVVGEDEQALTTEGQYYIVSLTVANRSETFAPFQFKPSFLVLEDAAGNTYPVSEEATAANRHFQGGLDPCAEPLRGGMSCQPDLVFEVPAVLEEPSLRIVISEGGFWKLLDLLFYGEKTISLG